MEAVIYNPLEEYESKYRALHEKNTSEFFDGLVKKSGVDIDKNRRTVKEYNDSKENLHKLKRKYNLLRVLRVLMIISVLLIPLVILKVTPKIQGLRSDIEAHGKKIDELFEKANAQMQPLNSLFGDRDALNLIEKTISLVKFAPYFSASQEANMKNNFDFEAGEHANQTTTEVLSGNYNGNPFLYARKRTRTMGTETYRGYKTITWTETYRDSDGKLRTRTRSETLCASVVKPKPYYSTHTELNYGAQGAAELSFSRDASHLERKSEREIERHIKRGEKAIKKKTDRAIKENDSFTAMANTDFEVLFDALDRTNEVEYRTLFTPLAQTNMVDLILSDKHYGDDFNFIKAKRMNKIITEHSQNRALNLEAWEYKSYSYDIIKESFESKNGEFFKSVYFDFAPLLSIPMYQERPVHSLDPLPDYSQMYSGKQYEVMANLTEASEIAHPRTKTEVIMKADFVSSTGTADMVCITAHSFDIEPRVDFVTMYGGDGRFHSVPVPWDEYIPLIDTGIYYVGTLDSAGQSEIIASTQDLCIYKI